MNFSFNVPFHSQINCQTKRVNEVLNQYFNNYLNVNQREWGEHLGLAKFCYKSTMHWTTKMPLFELALGKEAKKPMDPWMKGPLQGSCGYDQRA